MGLGLPVGITAAVAVTAVASYLFGWAGFTIEPWPALGAAVLAGVTLGAALGRRAESGTGWAWLLVVLTIFSMALWPTWPALLPPGGASDLTHHLLLVDVLERTRHLVDGAASEAALGEMAHYTPGLHLLIVIAASLAGVDGYRVAYPVVAFTVALKAGFVFLLAHAALNGARGRLPLAIGAVGLVLLAPRAYGVDGFLRAGFYAQVASELFVVAGWWGLARWSIARSPAWMAFTGLMGAAAFLTWPIWIGPLVVAVCLVLLTSCDRTWRERLEAGALAVVPTVIVGGMHLTQHAAWLRIAGTGGAVPAFAPGALGVLLMSLALGGVAAAWPRLAGRVTLWFTAGLVVQALALYGLARARGAETPYMAIKMIYLAVYPAAVLGVLAIEAIVRHLPRGTAWGVALLLWIAGIAHAASARVPPPIVDVDLHAAGRWARANLPAGCVDYIVNDADQAYWLHLAVIGRPRSSARTADIDGYTANRAIGRWIEGSALPYAVARRALLPGEVLGDADVVRDFGGAVVIQRRGVACPLPIAN